MGLIKSAAAPAALQPFSMADIEKAGRMLLLRAQRQAEQILVEAQKEAEGLHAAAYKEALAAGREEGLRQGREEGRGAGLRQALDEQRAELGRAVEALAAAAAMVDSHRVELEAEAVGDVIALAVAIAERVTKRQGAADPGVAAANVAEALRLVLGASDVRIAIHPAQRAALADALPQLKLQWPDLRHVELVEDPALAPGGCRLFTKQGQIDADLDGQLRRIAEELVPAAPPQPRA